jgi:hypothetical protein
MAENASVLYGYWEMAATGPQGRAEVITSARWGYMTRKNTRGDVAGQRPIPHLAGMVRRMVGTYTIADSAALPLG